MVMEGSSVSSKRQRKGQQGRQLLLEHVTDHPVRTKKQTKCSTSSQKCHSQLLVRLQLPSCLPAGNAMQQRRNKAGANFINNLDKVMSAPSINLQISSWVGILICLRARRQEGSAEESR